MDMTGTNNTNKAQISAKKAIVLYSPALLLMTAFILVHALAVEPPVHDIFALVRLSILIAFAHAAAAGDILSKRVPNKLVLGMLLVWIVIVTVNLYIDIDQALGYLISAGYGLLAGGGLFLLVYLVSRKGLGGGDVKFMAIAGLYLTGRYTLTTMLIGSVFAAIISLILLALKRITRKDSIALIPSIYLGILVTLFFSR